MAEVPRPKHRSRDIVVGTLPKVTPAAEFLSTLKTLSGGTVPEEHRRGALPRPACVRVRSWSRTHSDPILQEMPPMPMQPAKKAFDLGVIVADVARSKAFYVDLLGLQQLDVVPIPFGTLHRLGFGDAFVKLIATTKVPPPGEEKLTAQLGYRYLTFAVANIEAVMAECTQAEVPVVMPLQELRPGVRIAMVRDPDGNIVEFLQMD